MILKFLIFCKMIIIKLLISTRQPEDNHYQNENVWIEH